MTSMRLFTMTILLLAAVFGGCSGDDPAAPASAPAIDTSPPAVPVGLQAATGTRIVKLGWESNTTDADLAGYRIYRLAWGGSYLLTGKLLTENRYVDERPLGRPCGYAVSAVDLAGNESAIEEVRYTPPAQDAELHD